MNILVAIDFSKSSVHALEYAINFANKVKANIQMVWVNDINTPETVFSSIATELRLEKKGNFEKLLSKYREKLIHGKLDYVIKKGKVHQEIAKQVINTNANLVFTGTHGITGFEEYWIGSNAYRIITNAPCPVITIRNDYKFKKSIEKILFTVDHSPKTIQKLETTTEVAKLFNSHIHLLTIYTTSMSSLHRRVDNKLEKIKKYLKKNNINNTVEKIKTDNITTTALKYAEKNNVDLISIMTEQEESNAGVFLGTSARQIISNSAFPVLCVQPSGMKIITK